MSELVNVKVSKQEMMRLHRARMSPQSAFILKLNPISGLPLPMRLTKSQEVKVKNGARSITLSAAQMKKMARGGFLEKIPLIGPLLAGLFGKGNQSGAGWGGTTGGLAPSFFPLIRTIMSNAQGSGVSAEKIHGGFIGMITKLLGSLLGNGVNSNPKVGGLLAELASELIPISNEGMADYFSTPRKKSKKKAVK